MFHSLVLYFKGEMYVYCQYSNHNLLLHRNLSYLFIQYFVKKKKNHNIPNLAAIQYYKPGLRKDSADNPKINIALYCLLIFRGKCLF